MDWDKYSYVVRGSIRKRVLLSLKTPKIPSQVAKKEGISTSHVSRALGELDDKDLVDCKTSDQKMGRVYKLTEDGEEIVEELESNEQ